MKKLKLTSLILAVLMIVSMLPLSMITAFAAGEDAAETDWYTAETTDATPDVLEIYDQEDLLAFAGVIASGDGTEFAGKTINLKANIIMNAGWDAFAETVTAPEVQWPNTTGKWFQGTFNGNGYAISGAYLKGTGQYVGLFGNINTDTTATVENLIIVNSYITAPAHGVGTIFGGMAEPTWDSQKTAETPKQEAIMRNLYVDTNVVGTGDGNSNLGQGGLIGGNRAYITVENAVVAGRVVGGTRGVGGIVGQSRGHCKDNYFDPDNDGTKNAMLPTTALLTVKNVLITAELLGGNKGNSQSFVGGIVGYMNNASDKADFDNVIINATFGTNLPADAASGQYVKADGTLWYTGYIYGGAWGAVNYTDLEVKIWQEWWVDNVFYVANNKLVQNAAPVNKVVADAKWYINGATDPLNLVVDNLNPNFIAPTESNGVKRTDDGDANKAMGGNWNIIGVGENEKDKLNNKYLYVEWYDTEGNRVMVDEIGADGQTPTGRKVPGYKTPSSQDIIKEALPATPVADLTGAAAQTLLTQKNMAADWVTTEGMPMPKAVADMIAGKEIADAQSVTPAADADWFANETGDDTPNELYIYNADDLLAFATALNGGETFAGKTITLMANITMNAGWDAFAAEVTAPATVYPLANEKYFAGTFEGNGLTISGIYLAATGAYVGIFGSVATGTTATVQNLSIVNSYITGNNQGVGTIFGQIADAEREAVKKNETQGIIKNVYVDSNVVCTGDGNTNLGTGGFVGGFRADLIVENSAFVGRVVGGVRGVGGIYGQGRALETSDANVDGKEGDDKHYPTLAKVTVKNVLIQAELIGGNSNKQSFVGGVGGYTNNCTEQITLENVVIDCTFGSKLADAEGKTSLDEYYMGYIHGGHWGAKGMNGQGETVNQTWSATNVFFVKKDNVSNAIGKVIADEKWTVNGEAVADTTTINTILTPTDAAQLKGAAAMVIGLEGWTATAEGMMPTSIYEMTYEGYYGTSVTLKQDLSINVYYKMSGVASLSATYQMAGMEAAQAITSTNVSGDIHVFTISGIALDKMAEEITFKMGDVETKLTVKAYLVELLTLDKNAASAMLQLGAAAQTAAGATSDLVTEGLDLADLGDTTADITGEITYSGEVSNDYKFNSIELIVEDGVLKLVVEYKCYDMGGQQNVKVTIGDRESRLTYSDAAAADESRTYVAIFNDIDVTDLSEVITMTIMETNSADSAALSQTATLNVNILIKAFVDANSGNSAEDIALVKALHAVATSLN